MKLPTLALIGLLAAAAPAAATEALLRADITVAGTVVTLGDIFEDAGPVADVRVAAAPAPGERVALSASGVRALARANGIEWRGHLGAKWVWVARAGNVVPRAEIIAALEAALYDAGLDGSSRVELAGRRLSLHVPIGVEPSIEVEEIDFDRRSRRFRATVIAPAGVPDGVRATVSGSAHRYLEIPVLAEAMAVGEIIGERDIEWIEVRVDRVRRNIVTDASELVGLTPRRRIRVGEPIRARDVQRPIVIAKGEIVTLVMQTANMMITLTGRATENGSQDEVIDVMNTKSHRVVQGIVESPTRVRVLPKERLLAAVK